MGSGRRPSERSLASTPLAPEPWQALLATLASVDGIPPYASAGALYPVHPYLVTGSSDVDRAVLSYLDGAAGRCTCVSQGVAVTALRDALFEPWAWPVGCLLVLAVDFRRIRAVYGDRGLRFALIEVGSMSERWCRAAASVSLATCPVGGFHDLDTTRLLGLDPRYFGVALVVATGYARAGSAVVTPTTSPASDAPGRIETSPTASSRS